MEKESSIKMNAKVPNTQAFCNAADNMEPDSPAITPAIA